MNEYGFLILAAGSSSRLGQPKQLLKFSSTTLLNHCINIAVSLNKGPVFTVLGANADLIRENIDFSNSDVLVNENWQEGMGTTVAFGMRGLLTKHPELNGVLLMVCDQPFMSADLLNSLITLQLSTNQHIIASEYGNTLGTPVLFAKLFFNLLLQLKGQEGAKKIIYGNLEHVASLPFPGGEIDIDTAADYDQLLHVNE